MGFHAVVTDSDSTGRIPTGQHACASLLVRFPPCTLWLGMSSHQTKDMSTTGMQEIGRPTSKELDDANLARMGKRPVLKVRIEFDRLCLGLEYDR